MKDVGKEYRKKVSEFLDIVYEQNQRQDLTYKQDEMMKLAKEAKKLASKLPKNYFRVEGVI